MQFGVSLTADRAYTAGLYQQIIRCGDALKAKYAELIART